MVAGQGSHGQRRGMSPLKCGISEPMLHFQFGPVGQPFCQANYIEQNCNEHIYIQWEHVQLDSLVLDIFFDLIVNSLV